MKKTIYVLIAIIAILGISSQYKKLFIRSNSVSLQKGVPVKIAYNVQESAIQGPMIVAYEKGYLTEAGLQPELVPLKSGGEAKQALAGGTVDLASVGTADTLIAADKGVPVKAIAFSTIQPSHLFVRPADKHMPIAQLKGKKIASRSNGSGGLLLRYVLKKEGVDANTVTLIDIDKAVRSQALITNKIVDAALTPPDNMKQMENAGAVILDEWKAKGYSDLSDPGSGVINSVLVNTDFMNRQPEAVARFIDAYIKSQAFIKEHPDEAARAIAVFTARESGEVINPRPEEIMQMWQEKQVVNTLWMDPSLLADISKSAKELGILEKELTTEQIFDFRFMNLMKDAQLRIYGR